MTFGTLQKQTVQNFQWLPRLSVPGETSDLSYQMNQALKEATGDVIVFLQDYIEIPGDALEQIRELYQTTKDAYTFPMVKGGKEDWRFNARNGQQVDCAEWEIDFGTALRADIEKAGLFCEEYDQGFGWDNVDLGYRMWKNGVNFCVSTDIIAYGVDHDAMTEHPYRKRPNQKLWERRKKEIDVLFTNNSH